MSEIMRDLWKDESGQGLPEYALLVSAVVVMVVGATALFGPAVQGIFTRIGTYLSTKGPQ